VEYEKRSGFDRSLPGWQSFLTSSGAISQTAMPLQNEHRVPALLAINNTVVG
jgi:hypothetical protein